MTEELAVRPKVGRLVGSITAIMVVPPVVAGVFGTLGLAVVAGILSIFAGLIWMAVSVARWELSPREFPRAAVARRRWWRSKSRSY